MRVLFIRSSTNPGPRVIRMMRFFLSKGFECEYWAPHRGADRELNEELFRRRPLGSYEYFSGKNLIKFIYFILVENFRVLFRFLAKRHEVDVLHISDLELAFLVLPIARMLNFPIIFNVHDNFSQRYGSNYFITNALNLIESIYVKLSTVTLVPAQFRRNTFIKFCHNKVLVVHNFADKLNVNIVPKRGFDNRNLRVIYGGWISPTRGLIDVLDILEVLAHKGLSIQLTLCGWGREDEVEDFITSAADKGIGAVYLGQISQNAVIEELVRSDLSFALYDTSKPINVQTASNKIPEILACNTVLVTSLGTLIEQSLSVAAACVSYSGNAMATAEDIYYLFDNEMALRKRLKNQTEYFNQHYNEDERSETMDKMYEVIIRDS